MKLNNLYNDRGKQKYGGFLLSEHTATIEDIHQKQQKSNPQKRRMNELEIATIVDEAMSKNKAISVQIEQVNEEGQYGEDIIGKINGYDELGFYVNYVKVHYDEIRNITIFNKAKWSDMTNK